MRSSRDRQTSRCVGMIGAMVATLLLISAPARAETAPAQCEAASARAADAVGVPRDVLLALSLSETGRRIDGRLRPWPWALNIEGQGVWLTSRASARARARAAVEAGIRNIDLGCFQINRHWHGDAFESIDAMLDPDANALYAARFLRKLRTETGSWNAAAGMYHSRTPELAARYTARFRRIHAALDGAAPGPEQPGLAHRGADDRVASRRRNGYPLLQADAPGVMGSLVARSARSGVPLIASSEAPAGLLQ